MFPTDGAATVSYCRAVSVRARDSLLVGSGDIVHVRDCGVGTMVNPVVPRPGPLVTPACRGWPLGCIPP